MKRRFKDAGKGERRRHKGVRENKEKRQQFCYFTEGRELHILWKGGGEKALKRGLQGAPRVTDQFDLRLRGGRQPITTRSRRRRGGTHRNQKKKRGKRKKKHTTANSESGRRKTFCP